VALYAFDGTWNREHSAVDAPLPEAPADRAEALRAKAGRNTNAQRFLTLYEGTGNVYLAGVGTRLGLLGRIAGGFFGAGGFSRLNEMYRSLCENYETGHTRINIVGFSRGAALALDFANLIAKRGITDRNGRVITAQPVIDFINKVHEDKWAEIVWLTTWQEDANKVSDALGLPHFRHIPNPMWKNTRYAGPQWWKLTEAAKVYLEGRPTIWTDDDISGQIQTILRGEPGLNTLVITPSTNEGLAPVHLDKIAQFLGMPWES